MLLADQIRASAAAKVDPPAFALLAAELAQLASALVDRAIWLNLHAVAFCKRLPEGQIGSAA